MPAKFTSIKAPEAIDLLPVTSAVNDLAGQLAAIQSDLTALKSNHDAIEQKLNGLSEFSSAPDFWCTFKTPSNSTRNIEIISKKNVKLVSVSDKGTYNYITLEDSIKNAALYFVQFNFWNSMSRKGRGFLSYNGSNWVIQIERLDFRTKGYLLETSVGQIETHKNNPKNFLEILVWGWQS